MALEIAAWNAQESLAEPDNMPTAVEHINRLDADVVIVGDAYAVGNSLHGSNAETLHAAHLHLATLGYARLESAYTDAEEWAHDRNIMLLSRLAMKGSVIRLATRNGLEARITDDTGNNWHVVGAHFDDRAESTRVLQAQSFLEQTTADQPTILGGDLNTVHRDDVWARLLRSHGVRALAHLPAPRLRSVSRRLIGMAQGECLRTLTDATGFRDADRTRQQTFPANFPILQLDHFIVSDHVHVEQVRVSERSLVSDHRALLARMVV